MKFYASEDSFITSSDYLIGITSIQSLDAFDYIETDWQGTFPSSVPSGDYYVGWIIDEEDTINEYDENNNIVIIDNKTLHIQDPSFILIGIIIGVSIAGLIVATIAFYYLRSSKKRKLPDSNVSHEYPTYLDDDHIKSKFKTQEILQENPLSDIRYCTNCGSPLRDNHFSFCSSCGAPIKG